MTTSNGSQPLLEVTDLSVTFDTEAGQVRAVTDVSLRIESGEVLALVGESGSGKTATALSIMGLHPPTAAVSGSVRLNGTELLEQSESQWRTVRGGDIAMVFQDPMTALNPLLSVGKQIAETIRAHRRSATRVEALDRAAELLAEVGISDPQRRLGQYPHEFSGGMRQRLLIAMAIANRPKLLIADEPTTALDVTVQAQVMAVMREVRESTGAAMLLVTHDLGLVASVADRIDVMYAGRIFERADSESIFAKPSNPYTRGLLASLPGATPAVAGPESSGHSGASAVSKRRRLRSIRGTPPLMIEVAQGCAFEPRCDFSSQVCRDERADLDPVGTSGHFSRCHHTKDLP